MEKRNYVPLTDLNEEVETLKISIGLSLSIGNEITEDDVKSAAKVVNLEWTNELKAELVQDFPNVKWS